MQHQFRGLLMSDRRASEGEGDAAMPEQNEDTRKNQNKGSAGASEGVQVHFEGDPQMSKEEPSFLDRLLSVSFGRQRVPEEIITSFLRQLVMLLEAGVTPVLQGVWTGQSAAQAHSGRGR